MGYVLKDKNGNVIAKLLQFVATDEQVNAAITKYLDENGIHLAEGVDFKKMNSSIAENQDNIAGIKATVEDLKKVQNNVLLEYKDHFLGEFERGAINNKTGENLNDTIYARSTDYAKVSSGNTVLIANIPSGYQCAYFFYDSAKKFQGATGWMQPTDVYQISDSQAGWYVRASVYSSSIDLESINIILAGSAVSDIINALKENSGEKNLLGESELTTSDKLELNVTKASLEAALDPNSALVTFLTDLHIACPSGGTVASIAASASKIRRQLASYNQIAKSYPVDLCVFGGDYLNNSTQTNKDTAMEALKAVRSLIDQTEGAPVIIAKGNHDDNTMYTDYKNGYISIESLYRTLSNKDSACSVRNTDYLEMSYGYYDIPNKKIRVFILNTLDIPTALDVDTNKLTYSAQNDSGFRQEQIQFVADNLQITEKGWQVMFFCHHPFTSFAKEDAETASTTAQPGKMTAKGEIVQVNHGAQAMLDVIEGFKNGTKGTVTNTTADFETSVSFDFTKNGSNTVIACVYGHTHVYYHKILNGIHHIATRAVYGHPTFNFISTGIYFVINRKQKILKLIANGDGQDYSYEY